jgi:hypothetical protein
MAMSEDTAGTRIASVLKRLQKQPDAAKTTLQGRAISRSEDSLHLATATGIMAVPIDAIEDVKPLLATGDPNLVTVSVKDSAKVRHLLKVKLTDEAETGGATGEVGAPTAALRLGGRFGGFGGLGGGIFLPPIFTCDSFTNDYLDTATASGGVLDQTDDVKTFLQCDDHNV